jgi:hypothetical protein
MWTLLQLAIVFAVMASNIEYNWTPNPHIPALVGVTVAWFATKILSVAFDLSGRLHRWRTKARRRKQSLD